jgi:integrase
MPKHNPENERVKHCYATYMTEARGYDDQSVDAALAAIHRFEAHTNFRDFKTFRQEQAVSFKHDLAKQLNARTGKLLAKSTLLSILSDLKAFFAWLACEKDYRRRLTETDANFFNLTEREERIGRARLEKVVPTLEEVQQVIRSMPFGTVIERRDRALVAFILLTAGRDGAVITLKLKHVDIARQHVRWDAREVATKFRKSFDTYFYPVGDDIRQIVEEWVKFLEQELGWGPDDPLFPATGKEVGADGLFRPVGLDRKHWASADPVRKVFKAAFAAVGLPYASPHRVRDTVSMMGQRKHMTHEEMKAWSQNMGHERISTTLTSYGPVSSQRRAEIMRSFDQADAKPSDVMSEIEAVLSRHRRVSGT